MRGGAGLQTGVETVCRADLQIRTSLESATDSLKTLQSLSNCPGVTWQ